MQLREYAGPFITANPDYTGVGWDEYGDVASHVDGDDTTGYQSDNLTGEASLSQAMITDDGVIPDLSTIRNVVLEARLGFDALTDQGPLQVVPYLRYQDGAPIFQEPFSPPYQIGYATYQARFPRDPNGLPWTPGSIFRLRGKQLLLGLRTLSTDYLSAFVQWSELTFGVEFDLPVPYVKTDPASLIADTTAQFNGRVNPRGANPTYPLSYYFQWGTTTDYGNTTTPVAGVIGGDAYQAVGSAVSGLTASTGYHYRLVVVSADSTFYGDDSYFTTRAAGAGRWRLDEFKASASGTFTASDRARETSFGFDIASSDADNSTCPFLEYP